MTTPDDDQVPTSVAAAALTEIIAGCQETYALSDDERDRWRDATDDDLYRAARVRGTPLHQTLSLLFYNAELLTDRGRASRDRGAVRQAVRVLVLSFVIMSRAQRYSAAQRASALRVARTLATNIRVPREYRREIEDRAASLAELAVPDEPLLVLPMSLERLSELHNIVVRALNDMQIAEIAVPAFDVARVPSAVDMLAQTADRHSQEVAQEPPAVEYDMSGSELRLARIEIEAFRGSPGLTRVGFLRLGAPASAIIFGENGSGKSTISDAIEFALQGRIGRSTNFDSPLAPAIHSLFGQQRPNARATLSDGRIVERTTRASDDGVTRVDPEEVPVGFRLAPIALKRADILRFLDTEALERGTILLDYFPADTDSLAMRPDQEVHRYRAEMTELRIKRKALADDLSGVLGVPATALDGGDVFRRTIRELIMGGDTVKEFEERNGWSTVEGSTRDLIGALGETHTRLRACKRRLEKPVEVLNPMTYRRRTQLVRSVLADVGAELSRAFSLISGDHEILRIDVVFGASGPLSLDLLIRLRNGIRCFPQQVFSEAYQDLLALLFFVAVAKKASQRGQARILILDDVMQSVDARIRHAFVDYVLEEFRDWQLVITVHDRLWREQLRDLFDAHRHPFVEHSIDGWSATTGIQLAPPNADLLTRDLRAILMTGEPRTVGALAGQLLESICDNATRKLRIAVPRRDGDRYTLGDLWPAVRARFDGTAIEPLTQRVASFRGLRNLTVHADRASLNLPADDARRFAESVLSLFSALHCSACGSWVRGERNPRCSCGAVVI